MMGTMPTRYTLHPITYFTLMALAPVGGVIFFGFVWIYSTHRDEWNTAQSDLAQTQTLAYLYRCVAAMETTRDPVTQEIAEPLSEQPCTHPLLKDKLPEPPHTIDSSKIHLDRQKTVYMPGEYTLEIKMTSGKRMTFDGKSLAFYESVSKNIPAHL